MTSKQRVVLITGCSSGIGQATALRLARAGFITYASARNPASLAPLKQAGCRTLALDVLDEASMQAAVAQLEREHGALYALVNNAGYSQSGALETLPMEKVRQQFETNVFGLLRLSQLVLPGMRRAGGGRIVNVSSMGGTLSFPGGGAYHASKYAVEALSDVLRFEVAPSGVDVVVIQPGTIRTGFAETVARHMPTDKQREGGAYAEFNAAIAEATKAAYESGPLAKLGGEPDDVAKVIERALTVRRPKTRYAVTASAHLLMFQRSVLSDRLWDAMLRSQFGAVIKTLPTGKSGA